MAQVACKFVAEGEHIDYTPVSAVALGDVVVLGSSLVCIADHAISAGVKGAVACSGIFEVPKVTGSISAGAKLYYDDNADPVGGTAGSGAFTTNSALGPFAGWADNDGAASGDETVTLILKSAESPTSVARSSLGQDDLASYVIPLSRFQAPGTGAQLGSSAGTPSGALGLTIGTHGSASPILVGEAASGNSKTNSGRVQFALPAEYVSGETITLRVRCAATGTLATARTIDALVYKSDNGGGVGSDLCATSAQTITASFANYDFTITPTGLAAGDTLDVLVTAVANDTGGTNNRLIQIGGVQMLLDIKG